MTEPEVVESKPPQVLRERVRREHEAALAPRATLDGLPIDVDRAQLAQMLNPETLRRNADALPVLAAFQEFLDIERRRTRKRMLALTLIFLTMLVVMGAGAGLFGLSYYRRIRQQTETVRADLVALREQVDHQRVDPVIVSNLADRAHVLETTVGRNMNALEAEQDGLSSRLAGLDTSVAKLSGLKATIQRLQNQNTELTQRIEARAIEWQAMTNQVDRIMALLRANASSPTAATPTDVAAESAGAPAKRSHESLVLAIIPKGDARAIDWRVPLPSTQE